MIRRLRALFFTHAAVFKWLLNTWPPFIGAGIRIKQIAPDYRSIDVELKLRWYNKNYVNTHFGGNLFAMTDPFYMLMLIKNLGRDYVVWDKGGAIDFVAPGRRTVRAHFELAEDTLMDIRSKTADGSKYLPVFHVDIVDPENQVIAKVARTVYIRKKPVNRL